MMKRCISNVSDWFIISILVLVMWEVHFKCKKNNGLEKKREREINFNCKKKKNRRGIVIKKYKYVILFKNIKKIQ